RAKSAFVTGNTFTNNMKKSYTNYTENSFASHIQNMITDISHPGYTF
ncbi:26519_t:CDS:1, partial [Dentiscutata erythropus]